MRKITAFIALIVVFTGAASAQSANETSSAIQDAQQEVDLMQEEGIPTERVENLLETANNSYLAQKNFAEEGGTADYSRAIELTEQISTIQQRAIRASDRIEALSMRIQELEDTSVNLTSAKQELEAAEVDFESQRFEEADAHVEEGYSSISEAQSARTQIQSFAAAQQEALTARIDAAVNYVRSNTLKVISSTLLGLLVATLIFKEFNTYRLLKRKKRKRIKEHVLEELITDIQKEYYMRKEGSSIQFETKLDRFEEMRRDVVEDIELINRKIQQRRSLLFDTTVDEEEEIDTQIEEEPKEEEEPEKKQEEKRSEEPVEEQKDKEVQKDQESEEKEDETSQEDNEESNESETHEEVEVFDPSEQEEDENEDEWSCDECGESFGTERGLHIHETQQHKDEDESEEESSEDEGVACPVCGDVFDTERGMHIHKGEVHDN